MKSKRSLFCLTLLFVSGLHAAQDPTFQMPKVQEPRIRNHAVSITDFGAVPDGKTLNTEAIAKAIAAAAGKGGGKVVFPPGIWFTGPIELKSGIELHLEEGAYVQFTADMKAYPPREINLKGDVTKLTMSPIWGDGLTDIAITGRGVFDGAGEAWRPVKKAKMTETQWKSLLASGGVIVSNGEMWWPSKEAMQDRRPRLLKLTNCQRVLLEGVTFQNSPNWNLNPTLCEDLTIRNVMVRNPWYAQNGDGLDIEHCRNVIVRDSRFDVGDDAICLKSGANERGRRIGVPTENVLIEDCVVYHGHGGVTIGSEMSAGVRNVRVNNCNFLGTDLGLRFKSTRGRGGVVEKIFISNVRMSNIPTEAIGFNMYYGGQGPGDTADADATASSEAVAVTEGTPQFRDIYINDVICRGARRAVALQGLPEMPIRGIHLRNVSITAEQGIACTDAKDITFDNVEILNSRGPVLQVVNSQDVRLDHLIYPAQAQALAKAQGTKNAGIVFKNTDLKAAQTDFDLGGGATREVFKTE
jgi:polygalacturonase